jgi:predicted RecA/RadA family phage recombinase
MKNYSQEGDIVTVAAPYAVASGDGLLVGALFAVATSAAANGAEVEAITDGTIRITALGTDTGSIGAKVYWDNTNKRITTTASGNTLVGCLLGAKANGETTALVRLNGTVV